MKWFDCLSTRLAALPRKASRDLNRACSEMWIRGFGNCKLEVGGFGRGEVKSGKVEVGWAIPQQEQDAGCCCDSKTLTSVSVCLIFDIYKHIQFDLIFDALLDRWQDPIQFYQFFDPILEVWKEWVEFLGGWLIFHSWNINHIFQSISMAVHSSYWSIK